MKIPEYPECQIADIVTNYFIARTTSAGTIRMDPQFRERAHREWFLDGIGFLRIAKEGLLDIRSKTGPNSLYVLILPVRPYLYSVAWRV